LASRLTACVGAGDPQFRNVTICRFYPAAFSCSGRRRAANDWVITASDQCCLAGAHGDKESRFRICAPGRRISSPQSSVPSSRCIALTVSGDMSSKERGAGTIRVTARASSSTRQNAITHSDSTQMNPFTSTVHSRQPRTSTT
jgi:hypothetical protein